MKKLKFADLELLKLGATILGSGGGGDPKPELMRTIECVERHGLPTIIDVDELSDDDLVVPIAFMGAPLVSIEKLASGKETEAILAAITKYYGKAPSALVPAEIGGSNAFVPLALSSLTNFPVVDADTIGRAFPELHMSACALYGINASPTFLADSLGNTAIVTANSPNRVEKLCRALTESMGSSVAVALYLLTGKEAKGALVRGSISYAIELGKMLQDGSLACKRIASGIIQDIEQDIQGGFLTGKVMIQNFQIDFQNEYLRVSENGFPLVTTPDIIAILEKETQVPLPVEQLKYGLSVEVIALPAPKVWQSKEALEIVGPRAFGYDSEYRGIIV